MVRVSKESVEERGAHGVARYRVSPPFLLVHASIVRDYGRFIGAYGIAVYDALVSFADNDSGQCWPSQATIADMIGCSAKTVGRTLGVLERYGLITVEPQFNEDGARTSCLYTLEPLWLRESPGPIVTDPSADSESYPNGPRVLPPTDCESYTHGPRVLSPRTVSPIPTDSESDELYSSNYTKGTIPSELDIEANTANTPDKEGEAVTEGEEKPRKGADERAKAPIIQAYRRVVGKYPRKAVWDKIIAACQGTPNEAFLQECWTEWNVRGYNEFNLAWLLDWYAKGEIPPKGDKDNGKGGYDFSSIDANIRKFAAKGERKRGDGGLPF